MSPFFPLGQSIKINLVFFWFSGLSAISPFLDKIVGINIHRPSPNTRASMTEFTTSQLRR